MTEAYPLVARVMLGYKADLLAMEAEQIEEMVRAWLAIEQILQSSFDALALEIELLRAGGQVVKPWKLVRMQRYQSLIKQVIEQLGFYSTYAEGLIRRQQGNMLTMGIRHAVDAIRAYFTTYGKVASSFDILPVSAIEYMVGLAGDGSPLRALLEASWPSATQGLTDALIDAIALGNNPRDTARAMANGFGVGLDRAMNIARTEQLRVYRTANLEQYKASGVVNGYKRLSARDARVCPACLFADDGTIYPLDTVFEEHPQGRCTSVPVVIGMPEVEWQNGTDWFVSQDEETQRGILGPGMYDAWQGGEFELADVVRRVENDVWGNSLVPASLSSLLAKSDG